MSWLCSQCGFKLHDSFDFCVRCSVGRDGIIKNQKVYDWWKQANPEQAESQKRFLIQDIDIDNKQVSSVIDNNHQKEAVMQRANTLDEAKAYCDLGLTLYNNGKYNEAIENLNKAIDLDPNRINAYVHRGSAYFKKGQHDKAIEDYSKAITAWPDMSSTYGCRGLAYHLQGQYDSALDDYNKAVALEPDNCSSYFNIACAYSLKGDISKACDYLKVAIDKGFQHLDKIESEADFDNIRESDAYKQIVASLKHGTDDKQTDRKHTEITGSNSNWIDQQQVRTPAETKEIDINAINDKLKNIYLEKIITEQIRMESMQERISKWSNSIPNHELTDLGDKIKIVSAVEKPSYRITLQTLHEKRELKKGTEPHKGGQIPHKIITEGNVDIWSFSLPLIDGFKEEKNTYRITASQEVANCWECHGQGKVDCFSCSGSGVERCSSCSGRGEVRCSSCDGSGEHKCSRCGGSGQTEDYRDGRTIKVRCSSCGGRGHDPCTHCRNGWQNCSRCGGRGEVTCSTCSGRGQLTCSLCDGYREVVSYLYFNDIFNPTLKTELITHSTLPAEIVSGESIHIYACDGNNDKKASQIAGTTGAAILEVCQQTIPASIAQPVTHDALKSVVTEMIASSYERNDLGVSGKDYRLLKQKLSIDRLDTVEVAYKYAKKDYALWIYGENNNIIFSQISPISEVCDKYFSLAQGLFQKKEYSNALDSADKALQMNPKRDDIKTLKGKIEGRIGNQYLYGGLLGGSIAGALMNLVLKFVMTLSMSADKIFMVGIAIGSMIGLIVGLIFRFVSSTKVKESKNRFLYPLLTTVFTIVVAWIIYLVIVGNPSAPQYMYQK